MTIALAGVVTALAGILLAPLIPDSFAGWIGAESVDQILAILASSMLVVVTFSLSVAVQAYAAAATEATPRATQLLQEDHTTQNVLSVFVGAFLFSLVGVIALNAGMYAEKGRVALFVATIAMATMVVVSLIRWITHLMHFGRLRDTLDRVEKAATDALTARCNEPYLSGKPSQGEVPDNAVAVFPDTIGYVQHVDVEELSACAEELGAELWLADLPGSFVHPGAPLLSVSGAGPGDETVERIRKAFAVARVRTFDQDPRFGVIVLAEIASRALSPAVNDPGTAIDVLGRLVRVLSHWQEGARSDPRFPRVHVPPIRAAELLEDAFRSIARDGAALIEVQIRLQKALAAVAAGNRDTFGAAARTLSAQAEEYASRSLVSDADKQRLAEVLRTLDGRRAGARA